VIDVQGLRRENAELRKQSAMLATAERENAALRVQIAELLATIAQLNDRVGELLAIAQRKQRKPSTPTPPPAPPAVPDEARRAFEARPMPPAKPAQDEGPAKKRPPPTGRKPVPSHLEAEEHALRPEQCEHCGGRALDVADEVIEEKLHVVKEHQRRRVVRRTTCRCRECGGRTTPRSLPAPYERSKVTSEWLAWLVYQKFVLLTPLDRLRRDLGARGIHLAMGTLVSFIERAADLLAPIDGLHWRWLLAGSWMATDGTGLKVLVSGLPKAHNGYLELYRNRELAVFQYSPDKNGDRVAAMLRSFRGKLTADAESRFNAVFASGYVIETGCNAHGRRKFRDAEETQPVLAAEGGAYLGAIYAEEEKAQAAGLTGDALLAHRREHIAPLVVELEKWMAAVEPTLLPSEPLAAAIRYYRNHGEALFRFVDDAEVPIDNSPTEREFQNVAKLRLNMLFAGSTEGAHRACVLLGTVATCRAIGVPAQAYLAWAFDRLGTHRDVFGLPLEEMTPAAFKRRLAELARPRGRP
jgi:transposase